MWEEKKKEWVMYTLQPQQREMWGQDGCVCNPKLCLSQAGRKYVKYIFKKTKKKNPAYNLTHPNKLKNVYHKYLPHLTTAPEFLPSQFGFPGVSNYLGCSRHSYLEVIIGHYHSQMVPKEQEEHSCEVWAVAKVWVPLQSRHCRHSIGGFWASVM